jgi:hypothetical protein
MGMKQIILAFLSLLMASAALADAPQIVDVQVVKIGMDWRVDVTLEHPDTGWDHYADGWEILDASGNRLGYRELVHPHVDEQPFTRSLGNVMFPDGTREIFIRARCSVDGWADETYRVELQP